MLKHLKKLKNQKGMTLVELLAVMVIVGIIAAIAIPAIGGLIENTRKDAYISNATSVQEAARLYVVSNENVIEQNGSYPVTIKGTGKAGSTAYTWNVTTGAATNNDITAKAEQFDVYVESLLDPHTKKSFSDVEVVVTKGTDGQLTYTTKLVGSKYQTQGNTTGEGESAVTTYKDARNLTRNDIVAK